MIRLLTAGRKRCAGLALVGILTLLASSASAGDKLEYNRDIRPILAENCFACHGPDSASRKADLRLDQREAAIKTGAITPGKIDESELISRITSDDPDQVMPPAKLKRVLSPEQKDALKRWIADGAEYQPHWSLIAPKRPQPPDVKQSAWVRNPIDRFVLAKLEARGLQPAPEADRRTLIRRLSLDLTGLPPSPGDVDAFVNDSAPNAYDQLVERLLASPRWGEHRGRYWLDYARYADTHGIHFDNYRENWAYRDWVIRAFNRNLPFDQFATEQLAGDLLPNHSLDQEIGSGFNRCNITTNEGGAIDDEYLVLYTRDRTETTAQVFLGLTAGCAVCHDHKFDPLSQKEFYELAAFFNNTTQRAMDGNIKDTPPIVFVPLSDDQKRWKEVDHEAKDAKAKVEERKKVARADFDSWLSSASASAMTTTIPADGLKLHAPLTEGDGKSTQVFVDSEPRTIELGGDLAWKTGHVSSHAYQSKPGGVVELADAGDFERDQGFSYGAWVQIPKGAGSAALIARMDESNDYRGWDIWLEGGKVGSHIIHKWPDDALKAVANNPIKIGEWTHVFITYDGSSKVEGLKIYINGKSQPVSVQADGLKNSIKTTVPFKVAQRSNGQRVNDLVIQDIRLYGRALPEKDVEQLARSTRAAWLASKPAGQRGDAENNELYDWWLPANDTDYQKHTETLAAIEKEQATIRSRGTIAHVMHEKGDQAMAYILYRGDYDKRRDEVKPSTPAALPPFPADQPKNRLGFAQWLLSPEHPLTARVTVNRFWQEVFGAGIVKTAGDFGVTGELPTHPELLDWLAVEFRESGWNVKDFFKLIVSSASYRQSSVTTPEKLEKDPANKLLSRGPRFRMDAEMVRDYALAASGLLSSRVGGPSVKPYQPEGVWEAVAMIGSNTRDYRRDSGESLYRRSFYTFWKRAAPPASMDIFNAPSREVCTVRRERTNTPLQALVTLNDPQFVEAARGLAERILKDNAGTTESRIDELAKRLLGRSFRAEEAQVVNQSLERLLAFYTGHVDDAKLVVAVGESKPDLSLDIPTLAAWTMLTNELMNLDEVLNK
jgi:mono/diheme cytochrome c family protein